MAPADGKLEAEGDGGGSTGPVFNGCGAESVVVVTRGELAEPAALPLSESSGICTLSRGRNGPPPTRRCGGREGGGSVDCEIAVRELVL